MMKVRQPAKIQTKFGSLCHLYFVVRRVLLSLSAPGMCEYSTGKASLYSGPWFQFV